MRKGFIIIVLLFIAGYCHATHQRAGEITYRWIGGLTYEVKILTYTYAPSPADRPELEINWGDNTTSILPRLEKVDLPNEIRRNVYIGQHTYNGNGSYIISVEDPNRNFGILNIPNSVNVPFFVQTLLVISPFYTPNNSVQLLLPPVDNGCTNYPYIHNPGAYDPDGDSLSYKLVVCRGAGGLPIPGFVLPNEVGANIGTQISIDPATGEFIWDSPKMQGEYNIAIIIEEWRYGIKIGYVIRDMQIIIQACNNHPPVIDPIPDTCVLAGGLVSFVVRATDIDNNKITLSGTGGPLVLPMNMAVFRDTSGQGSVSQTFSWLTICGHVKIQPYTVYFKAIDNSYPVNLVDIKSMNIKVIGPAIPELTVKAAGNAFRLNWQRGPCNNAKGYKIYRRSGFYGYSPAYCETGVPAYTGYQWIATISDMNDTSYLDDNQGLGLIPGVEYCYMVISYFPDGSESVASEEECASLKRDLPILTHVSIRNTDVVNGSVFVDWVKPDELDSTQTPGPFKYFIYRSLQTGSGWNLIDSIDGLNDTVFVDSLIDTRSSGIGYQIGLLNNSPGNRFLAGKCHAATSVFLSLTPTDESIRVGWSADVPWTNDTFIIYRQNPITLLYDSIGQSARDYYTDTGLVNASQYCYRVKSKGSYSAEGLPKPLINYSQTACASPFDNVPPCPPGLTVSVNCALPRNTLVWTNPNDFCSTDTYKYYIYYRPEASGDFILIDSLSPASNTTYHHAYFSSIVGCYAVTAIDSAANQSLFSNIVCVDIDSCDGYRLPNVFTPNSDNFNDLFHPFPYNSVDRININIFNRWGMMVYKTEDPDINWNGKDINSGQACSEGVYYYVCDVYERKLNGLNKRSLTGIIHLINKK